jgi:hypothetical protein
VEEKAKKTIKKGANCWQMSPTCSIKEKKRETLKLHHHNPKQQQPPQKINSRKLKKNLSLAQTQSRAPSPNKRTNKSCN